MANLVHIENLAIEFRTRDGDVRALDGVNLDIGPGERIGIMGESGSGKSTLATSIARLLPPNAVRAGGDVLVQGHSIFAMSDDSIRALRNRQIGYVFQDPLGTLDPTMRIRDQIETALRGAADRPSLTELLRMVELPEPERVGRSFPHELSGGMAQRVAIAIAVGSGCRLLIADEPTAALDASIRRQILDLLVALSIEKGAALVLLSHDLPAIAKHCERVAVMYGGRIVECGSCETVFRRPRHPYTAALLKADPGNIGLGDRLEPILGTPPLLRGASHNCSFAPRCAHAVEACHATRPAERVLEGRIVACIRAEETAATMGSGPI